jgi:hypothetical protein
MRHLVEVYDDVHITLSLCVYDNQGCMIAKLGPQCKYYFDLKNRGTLNYGAGLGHI